MFLFFNLYIFAGYYVVSSKARRSIECAGMGVTGSCELPVWVLETKPRSFERVLSTFNC